MLFVGIVVGFIIADGIAVFAGKFISSVVPLFYIKLCSAFVFTALGINEIRKSRTKDKTCLLKSPFLSGFGMILASEIFDK